MTGHLSGWWTTRHIRRLTFAGRRNVAQALDAIERAEQIGIAFHELATSLPPASSPPSPQRRSPRLLFVAVGLTVLNAAAVVLMLTLPNETAPTTDSFQIVIAALFGFLLASTELTLAVTLGHRFQTVQHIAPPTLPTYQSQSEQGIPFEAAALGLLCALIAWLTYLWTQIRIADLHPHLAVILGVCLALQAWTAPWLLVAEIAHTRPTGPRLGDLLDRHRDQLVLDWETERAAASHALVTAQSALHHAEHVTAKATELNHQTPRASWTHHRHGLTAAINETQARYFALTTHQTPSYLAMNHPTATPSA